MYKILFVCLGNICRSPSAEGVFRKAAEQAGMVNLLEIDSAGTHNYHVGESPDGRAQQAAARRGIDLSGIRGRQVSDQDFAHYDLILAMDDDNLVNLQARCDEQYRYKLHLFMEFSHEYHDPEVPDPYYGGGDGFERVLDMLQSASDGLIEYLREELGKVA